MGGISKSNYKIMAEKIKLTFLGTSSGVPTIRRNHPAVLIQYKDENILFDCGEGTQRQFRKAKLNPCKITKIFITHWHGDHVFGLPGLFQTLALNGYKKTLNIYGPKGTNRFIGLYKELFVHKRKIEIQGHEITANKPIDEKEFQIQAQEMKHDAPCLAYSFTIKQKPRLDKAKLKKLKIPNSPLLAKLAKGETIKYKGKTISGKDLIYKEPERKITIIMDTIQNPNTTKIAKDSNILICESTYLEKEKQLAREYKHLTSEQAAQIAKDSNSKKLYLTHISQKHDTKSRQKKILDEAKKVFKNTTIAEDFMSFEI